MSDTRQHGPKGGYGNIYTPHAGSMIIHVQREGGLANRTLVLTPRQVRLLRWLMSRRGVMLGLAIGASWAFFAMQAARVPLLNSRIRRMEHTTARLDTLERALGEMQRRYDQVQHMLGATTPGVAPAATTPPAPPAGAPATGTDASSGTSPEN